MALWQLCSIYTGGSNMLALATCHALCRLDWTRDTWHAGDNDTLMWQHLNFNEQVPRVPYSYLLRTTCSQPRTILSQTNGLIKYSLETPSPNVMILFTACTRNKITKPRSRCNKAVTGCIYLLPNTWAGSLHSFSCFPFLTRCWMLI